MLQEGMPTFHQYVFEFQMSNFHKHNSQSQQEFMASQKIIWLFLIQAKADKTIITQVNQRTLEISACPSSADPVVAVISQTVHSID